MDREHILCQIDSAGSNVAHKTSPFWMVGWKCTHTSILALTCPFGTGKSLTFVRLLKVSHEAPFESEQHPMSRRWAVVEDDGKVAWLYLTAPDSLKPVATCFLYNQNDT